MSEPCRATIRAVRGSQLSLCRQVIDRLETAVDGLPSVNSQLQEDSALDDEELADCYMTLRERLDVTIASLKNLHFLTAGRFAQEMRKTRER